MQSDERETERLVEAMERRLERKLDPLVRNAFLQVPRHPFIEHYYQQQGNRLTWDRIITPAREAIYADEALITKVDERGYPISSSSQPSVMAQQLEMLELHPGLSVLEIGAGTGYNAALMGTLVGPTGQIISIDIDQELIATALQHLNTAHITNVLVTRGDGFKGYPERAPYHRLLATCSVHVLPRVWIAQLTLGGLVLVNLHLHLSSIFLLLRKTTSTVLEGRLFDLNAAYMEMHGLAGLPQPPQVDWSIYDKQPHHEVQLPADLTKLLEIPAYSMLLECLLPALRKKYRAFPGRTEIHTYLIDTSVPGTAIQVQGNCAIIIGAHEHLETQLRQSIERYERLGLTMEDYQVSLRRGEIQIRLRDQHFTLEI